ncbi:MAG: hypothetical protein ACC726_03685 [Chloroflexota bacterium]
MGISGRTDDTLNFDVTNFTWRLVAYYFGGAALEFGSVANAACSTCNGNFLKTSVAVPAGAVDGTCIVVCASAGDRTTGSARPTSPPSTSAWAGAIGSDWGRSHYATLTGTTDVGLQISGLQFYQIVSNVTIYDTNPSVVGVPIGMEMGFNAGTVAEVADKTIQGSRLKALEVGFNAGRLDVEASRQVALLGEGIETPEMTAGGTEGQVLTQHVGRRPTWEDGGASLTVREADGAPSVASVDTIVVNDGSLTDDGSGQITLDNTGPAGPAGPTGPAASPGLSVYLYDNFK